MVNKPTLSKEFSPDYMKQLLKKQTSLPTPESLKKLAAIKPTYTLHLKVVSSTSLRKGDEIIINELGIVS